MLDLLGRKSAIVTVLLAMSREDLSQSVAALERAASGSVGTDLNGEIHYNAALHPTPPNAVTLECATEMISRRMRETPNTRHNHFG